MQALIAVVYREGRIRATNVLFIFWDLIYPLAYLLVFGVGLNSAVQFTTGPSTTDYNAFFLAGVLGMASFGIASNTAWSFFLDRDNGIYFEMLTYPISRAQYLVGKVAFNIVIALAQAAITLALAEALLGVQVRWAMSPFVAAMVIVGTAGWFFLYSIFAVLIRRNDAFNTVTSVFYFVLLFASSMFYPLEPLPAPLRAAAYANPITWQVDVLRYTTTGLGDPSRLPIEILGFAVFTAAAFAGALTALKRDT
jgi:ABC-type multidrug transport system permease subunit